MTLAVAWLVYPLVLSALSLGCGLLLDAAGGRRLPGTLLLPAGFAAVVVVASLTTMDAATAPATTPLVVALAVAGLGLARRARWRVDGWAVLAALGVFCVYAAPIVLSGGATFAGYLTLDDTATWLALADNALHQGRSLAGLPPSTYQVVLHDYLSTGYPLGAFLPLGIGHQLTRHDSAWLFQPQIAFLAAMLGLSIYTCAGSLVRRRPLRVLTAFLGAQAALLFAYAFWSGIKEVTAAALIALLAALVASLPGRETRMRDMLPLAVVAAAVLDVLAIVGGIWFVAIFVLAPFLLRPVGLRRALPLVEAVGLVGLVLAAPSLREGASFLHGADASGAQLTTSGAFGAANLGHALNDLQVLGIWPAGDFRQQPPALAATYVLLAVLALAAVAGLVVAVRRGAWGIPLLLGVAGGGALSIVVLGDAGHGSAWLDGKALAIASPAFVAAGIAGGASLLERGGPALVPLGALATAAIAAGVLWSNGLAYANVWLAPRAQLAELETIGKRFAGDGPTLMTEYQPYGVRHFLRALAPEGASERRSRLDVLRAGGILAKEQYADIDAFELLSVLAYRTLVLRGSPSASRPPSPYRLVWTGRYYEVWQRPAGATDILEHISLGTGLEPVAVPDCGAVQRLAALAAAHSGTLVASERAPAIVVGLASAALPPGWSVGSGGTVVPSGPGAITERVRIPKAAVYGFWLGGSFRDTVSVRVDGKPLGSRTDQLSETAQLVPFATAHLTPGVHTVTLAYTRSHLRPGTGSYQFGFGPLELGEPATQARLVRVVPSAARSLCGKQLDWIEAVAPTR